VWLKQERPLIFNREHIRLMRRLNGDGRIGRIYRAEPNYMQKGSSKLQIVLMRHGKPKTDKDPRLNAREFGAWVERYNASGLDLGHPPPQIAIAQASQCAFTVCSTLLRSLESAKVLGVGHIGMCDPLFREMEMPHAMWSFPRLSVSIWLVFFRLVWALGYSAHAESFQAARERARGCAENLATLASAHGAVLFVGHGSLNWFIAQHLKRMGWSCSETPPKKYWQFSVFSFQGKK
jgi:broad specificity phosphatase PhoE